MNFVPLMPNWMEIVSVFAGYCMAAAETSRRLSWHWHNKADAVDSNGAITWRDGEKQFGAAVSSFFALPIAYMLVRSYDRGDSGGGWEKPPKAKRKELKRAEQREAFEELQRENNRMEKLLKVYEA